ncbi:lysophospholipid acyltransferase family protein [Aquabacterium sp.]|uniref:lysophospholipid acyltransferase family protein n=1 Tax=Aquabacterium sp. TaxID=1872578 RepID=UPI002E31BEC0|nr:lysophospholipid acyltransferase family protein [Aquabacterium sp.]HEX5310423.1 lysophospholipid acyltransferase family protein [Aquabacterium sp.]
MWPVALWRLLRVFGHILRGLLIVYWRMPGVDERQRMALTQDWAARLLAAMGIELVVHGTPHAGAKLVVANHISWLDIMAIDAVVPARFVSKAEVGRWPLVGKLVTAAGTLYLQRERRRDAMRVLGLMSQALQQGSTVAVFPEGTTGSGHGVLPFHANLLQAAIDAKVPIQPVSLRYSDISESISSRAAYVGDTTLLQSLWWVVSSRGMTVHVTILAPQAVSHADRRSLAASLQELVDSAIPG